MEDQLAINSSRSMSKKLPIQSSTSSVALVSESQLSTEFHDLSQILKTKTQEEWSHRCQALVKLQGYVKAGMAEYDSFIPTFNKYLREPLIEMVTYFKIT